MMKTVSFSYILIPLLALLISGCDSSSGSKIDALFGSDGSPLLTNISALTVSQGDLLNVDVNNIRKGAPGSDEDMSYSCFYDLSIDGEVADTLPCASIPNSTVTFSSSSGILNWTPLTALGNYEVKIKGNSSEAAAHVIFTVGVRLKFNGITSVTSINGTGATLNWTPNPAASNYQISRLNTVTGLYEVLEIVAGGGSSGHAVAGLMPNSPYTLRVNALDVLGYPDTSTVDRSFTTTTLTRLSMVTASPATVAAGTAVNVTVNAFNNDGSPQTIGGLTLIPAIQSGTSSGNFSAVTDHNNGSYSFTFTPTTVGSAVQLEVSMALSYFLNNTIPLTIVAGAASSANSTLSLSASSVSSANNVSASALIRDAYNNPLPSATVVFSATGGTSTGTFSAVTNAGSGNYSGSYTGIVAGTAQTVRVTVNGSLLTPTQSIQVVPGTVVAANSSFVLSSNTIASGTSTAITATLRDINNNPIPSGVLVAIGKTGGTSTGSLAAVVNAGSGVYTSSYDGINSGTPQTLTLFVDSIAIGLSSTIEVIPGAVFAANSTLNISSPTVTSGNFVTATATLRDLNNNPIDSGITVTFSKTGGTSTGTFNAVNNAGAGAYNVRYTGVVAGTAQAIAVLVNGVATTIPTVNVTVNVGSPEAANSSIATSAATITAGSLATITATIRDLNNNPITSGILVAFAKAGGTSTGNFSSVTNMGNGQYAINYSGVSAGSAQTISVIVDGAALGPTTTVAVTAGAPSSIMSTLTLSSGTVVSGSLINVTAVIRDSFGNPISSGIIMNFDKSGGTSTGNFGTVNNDGNGQYSTTYTGVLAGTAQTIQANVNLAAFGPTQSIQVLVGTPHVANCNLTITSSPVSSDSTALISAVIRDVNNNPIVTEYVITFDAIGGSSTGTIGAVSNGGSGNFSANYAALIAGSAQTVRVLIDGTPLAGLTRSIQVVPGSVNAANSTFSISPSTVQSGSVGTISMNLRDTNNNAITSGLTITFNKTIGVSDGNIGSVTNLGSGNYSANYTATSQGTAQTITLVVNSVVTTLNTSVTVTAGTPTQFIISGPANPINSIDCAGPYTITLKDSSNNTTVSTTAFNMSLNSAPINLWQGNLFSDAACTSEITTNISFSAFVSTQNFYFKSYVPQTMNLTLTPSLGAIAAASQDITNSAVLSWIGTSAAFTFNGSGRTTVQDDTKGFQNPTDVVADGSILYVVDVTGHRILKLDLNTNAIIGWLGTIGGKEGLTTYDATNDCQNLAVGAHTTKWCVGGRGSATTATLISSPRGIAVDSTYIYVSQLHRILRFDKTTGAYGGWIGRISGAPSSPASCVLAGAGNVTPTWCFGGTSQTGTGDGHYNNPQMIYAELGYLYISDYSNHRIQKIDLSNTNPQGWIGQVNTAPPAGGQLASCSPLPATNDVTPGWCLGGTAKISNRYNLAGPPSEVAAPNEGFNLPIALTVNGSYLYVGDGNARIVRINLSTGAFAGWIGNSLNRTGFPVNIASPAVNATTRYTTDWSTNGVTFPSSSNTGFHPNIRGLANDGTYLYITDDYSRLARVNISDGQNYQNIGRVTATPAGGVSGCSSTPIGGVTPGWCTGGNFSSVSNVNSAFHSPYGIAITSTPTASIFVTDYNNFRVQKLNLANGSFQSWIGMSPVDVTTFNRSTTSNITRAGFGDYSMLEVNTANIGIGGSGNNLFMADYNAHRIKKFNKTTGLIDGYVGIIGTYAPTNAACIGFTSGLTPAWCTGGGRTSNGSGIMGFQNPTAVAASSDYVYVANASNNRIDRVRISDGIYMGWIGRVSTTPTDGPGTCTSTAPGNSTPDWCIGGLANATTAFGSVNFPRALTLDSSDGTVSLYVVDNYPRLLRINAATGQFTGQTGNMTTPVTGGCSVTSSVSNGWCATATAVGAAVNYGRMGTVGGITTDATYIYIIDASYHRITRFNKSTGAVAGVIGRLNNTTGLDTTVTGGACNGLVAGFPRATPGWCYGTALGSAITASSGSTDNTFNTPYGIWADGTNIYVADSGNNRVVKIDAATGTNLGWKGVIADTTGMTDPACIAAGVGAVTPKWCTGGRAANSRLLGGFDYPTGLWGDVNYIYVYDTRNNRTVTVPKN